MPKVSHGRPDLRPATKEPARAGHGWTQWVLRDASSLASPGGNDYRAGPVAMDPRPRGQRWLPAKDNAFRNCQEL